MKRCPKCEGRYFDDMMFCSECFGGGTIELVTEEEYKTKTGKGFETLKRISYEREKLDLEYEKAHPLTKQRKLYAISNNNQQQNIPRCPTCGSTNIKHISSIERGINALAFGLLGNKRKYQFECLNPQCKYKW